MKDSVLNHVVIDSIHYLSMKINIMQGEVSKMKKTPLINVLAPIVSAILGGCLVLVGQYIDRLNRRKTETKNRLKDIFAECQKLQALMKNNYRELAMAKVHVEYWWYCYNLSVGTQKDYDEHLRSQSYGREIERQIGEIKAEYIGQVYKFKMIKALPVIVETELNKIIDLSNAKAKRYSNSLSYDDVRFELVGQDEHELRELYYLNLHPFYIINYNLEEVIKEY